MFLRARIAVVLGVVKSIAAKYLSRSLTCRHRVSQAVQTKRPDSFTDTVRAQSSAKWHIRARELVKGAKRSAKTIANISLRSLHSHSRLCSCIAEPNQTSPSQLFQYSTVQIKVARVLPILYRWPIRLIRGRLAKKSRARGHVHEGCLSPHHTPRTHKPQRPYKDRTVAV